MINYSIFGISQEEYFYYRLFLSFEYMHEYFTHIYTHTQYSTFLNKIKKIFAQIKFFLSILEKNYSKTQIWRVL